jgi:hypothetical protein
MVINNTKCLNKEFSKLFIEKRIALYATRLSERTLDNPCQQQMASSIVEDDNETSQRVPQQIRNSSETPFDCMSRSRHLSHKPLNSLSTESTSSSYFDTSSCYDDYTNRGSITHCALSTNDIASMSPFNAMSDESVFTDGDDFIDYSTAPKPPMSTLRHLKKDDDDDDDRTINESSYKEANGIHSRLNGHYHYNYDDEDDDVFNTKENDTDVDEGNGLGFYRNLGELIRGGVLV